jgi:MFS superfamily sulfate permease-like transporter
VTWKDILSDFLVGITFGMLSFPTALSVALISGSSPFAGMNTVIVAQSIYTVFAANTQVAFGNSNVMAVMKRILKYFVWS